MCIHSIGLLKSKKMLVIPFEKMCKSILGIFYSFLSTLYQLVM